MDRTAKREIRRRQIEQYFATEDMTVAQWCALNKVSESTFYKWAAVFRREEPGLFGDRGQRASDWIEVSRREVKDSVALATVSTSATAPASSLVSEKLVAGPAGTPQVSVVVKGITVSVPDGVSESTIAAVLRAAVMV